MSRLLGSPRSFLQHQLPDTAIDQSLSSLEQWWLDRGDAIAADIDRLGCPHLQQYAVDGQRIDSLTRHSDYAELIRHGHEDGIIARLFTQNDVLPFFQRIYLHAFFDPGIAQVFSGSMVTALALQKYSANDQHLKYLSPLLKTDGTHWQGAFWSTERGGGSDPGNNTHTLAKKTSHWLLRGEKCLASNPQADLALVLARPAQLPAGNQALSLFAVPRRNSDGELNFQLESITDTLGLRSCAVATVRLHDSEALLLDDLGQGYELMRELKAVQRVAQAVSSMALAQRCIHDAAVYASQRTVFGQASLEQPLMKQQFRQRMSVLHAGFKLVWECVELLNQVWRLKPPYSDRHQTFTLFSHLARYWSAEFAAQTAKWNLEVQASHGLTRGSASDRRLRDAMTLLALDGTAQRQILQSLKLLQQRDICTALFDVLRPHASAAALTTQQQRLTDFLQQPLARQEDTAEPLIKELSWFVARSLIRKHPGDEQKF